MVLNEASINMYGEDYNLTLLVNLFTFKFRSYKNDSKEFDVGIQTI